MLYTCVESNQMKKNVKSSFYMTLPEQKFPGNCVSTNVLYFYELRTNLVLCPKLLSFHPPSVVHWRARRVEGKVWN